MNKEMMAIFARGGSSVTDDNVFYSQKIPIPEPGEQDLLIRIKAIGMNPVDTKVRQRAENDKVLGWDACGVVEKTGDRVSGFQVGDTVFYAGDITRPGCNSEYQLVDQRIAALAPKGFTAEDCAAVPLTSITAWEGLFDRLGFIPEANGNGGKTVMIIGGAGGVGSMAIQLANWAGLTVIATASRPETDDWCKKLGAHVTLNHRNDLAEELGASNRQTVDAIFCTTAMEKHWQAMAACIRPQGHIVLIDDPSTSPDITIFKMKSVSISWEFMYTRSMFATEDMAEQAALLASVAKMLEEKIIISTRKKTLTGLTPENIQAMHVNQESGTMIGKQVLTL